MVGNFPAARLRRLRRTQGLRDLAAETTLQPADLIRPLFVTEQADLLTEVPGLPDVVRYRPEDLPAQGDITLNAGIRAVMLFPCLPMSQKNTSGSEALNPNNLICRSLRLLKQKCPELLLIADVALDPYTTHGHDGVLNAAGTDIDNDATVELLVQQALVQAAAGADMVAPSDMCDGRIGAVRNALEQAGLAETVIVSYAAKYASCFYGPFRRAAGSAGLLSGDKRGYQMDYRNGAEAVREAVIDVAEGADIIMVKPGLPYADVIKRVAEAVPVPVWGYQVSGEYAMLHAGAAAGAFNFNDALLETLTALKRAGCSSIVTYGALRAAGLLKM